MAITATARGTYTDNAGSTTSTFSPSGNFASGSWAVIFIAADNSASAGGSNNITSVTDDLGNTWTKRNNALYDPGAANAGVQGASFTCPMDKGPLTTSTVITVTFGAATTADCGVLWEVTPSAGWQLAYGTGAVGTGSATTTPTVTTSSITSGNIVFGGLFNEEGTGQVVTGDADASSGSWSTQQTAAIGTGATGMVVQSQYKVVTGTATQTFNPTLGTSSDVILGWISMFENVNPKVPDWVGGGWW